MRRQIAISICFIFFIQFSFAQSPFLFGGTTGSNRYNIVNKKRLKTLIVSESSFYVTGMTGAYFLWYKNTLSSQFRFFNDANEWLLMDKCGHFVTSHLLAKYSSKANQWTGIKKENADKIATLQSLFMLTSLEVWDGFSSGWGFSWADMGFNVLGSGTFYISQRFNHRIDIQPKFSFGESEFAQYRPSLLGNNFLQQSLKDYNGQTYWLSINLNKVLAPAMDWGNYFNAIQFSFGYGANGMTGGHENPLVNEQGQAIPYFDRYRQYYFSLDLDLSKIPVSSPLLKSILTTLNIFKFPFPALELSRGKVFGSWSSYGR